MRTPLHGVIGMLELAADGETSPQRLRQLEMARRSAEALLGTIDDILDFSKIEARKLDLEPVYFSLREMMQETVTPTCATRCGRIRRPRGGKGTRTRVHRDARRSRHAVDGSDSIAAGRHQSRRQRDQVHASGRDRGARDERETRQREVSGDPIRSARSE